MPIGSLTSAGLPGSWLWYASANDSGVGDCAREKSGRLTVTSPEPLLTGLLGLLGRPGPPLERLQRRQLRSPLHGVRETLGPATAIGKSWLAPWQWLMTRR